MIPLQDIEEDKCGNCIWMRCFNGFGQNDGQFVCHSQQSLDTYQRLVTPETHCDYKDDHQFSSIADRSRRQKEFWVKVASLPKETSAEKRAKKAKREDLQVQINSLEQECGEHHKIVERLYQKQNQLWGEYNKTYRIGDEMDGDVILEIDDEGRITVFNPKDEGGK